jgi:drug/metabolite transporter (DMT)-like permease
MKPRTVAHLLLLFTVFIWGSTFALVKAAMQDVSPLLFNFLRMTIATIALVAIHHRKLHNLPRRYWLAGAAAGVFLALGYEFQTFGLTLTTAAKSGFITGMVVVFVPALTAIAALRPRGSRPPGPATAIGAASAFLGLIFLTTPAGTTFRTVLATLNPGDLITLACALAFAAHLHTLAHWAPDIPSGPLATLQIAACTLVMLLSLPLERSHIRLNPTVLFALILCGLVATAAAFTIQSYAQRHLPPTHTVLLLTLEPVFAWLTSLIFLHESLDSRALIGATLILAGIAFIEFSPSVHTTEIPA